MVGSAARMVWKHPFMLRVTISSNSSGVVCTPVLPIGPEPPATLTRISMRPPNWALVFSTAASHCLASVRSQGITIAVPPFALTSAATGSIAAVSLSISASLQPSAAKAWVMEAPMPLAGPVMSATRSSSESFIKIHPCWVGNIGSVLSHRRTDHRRPLAGRWQETAVEYFQHFGSARQFLGLDQDVDRLGHPLVADIADADFRDFRMAHLV